MHVMPEKIIIADDHPLFRQALLIALKEQFKTTHWLEAETVESINECLVANVDADLLLLDLNIPGAHGFDHLIRIRKQYPNIPVVVISAYSDETIISKAMQHGASGFVPKSESVPTIISAISKVLAGQLWVPGSYEKIKEETNSTTDEAIASLTVQEYRILMMFSEGLLNKQIGDKLCVAEATVKAHASAIFRKLNVRNRTQAAMMLGQLDVVEYSNSLKE
ncbi:MULTISPECIES: response regulator transcription factor [unclassified Moritella]|uniref:response regulator n=1 Tax=unclassified Moritella TaxID=2637987 RepID=UPI001BA87EE9|nr:MULTISPECIES: response regulator transcription factor [unclassified Moritella]QUM82913.1 response regulator transcription factor [Moritella sp. 5]QUM87225.1 response regulator transcription factor [Moritella sp. 28]QUM91446.1 response regulator transcription factor [Moritella sp. 36]